MRYVVTGGAGFIGSHLARNLVGDGQTVTVLDDLSTGCYENIADLCGSERFDFVRGSVCDVPLVTRLVSSADRVFHLAAVVGVMKVMADPIGVYEENRNGAESVLAAAARQGKKILIASSSEVYGPGSPCRNRALGEDEALTSDELRADRWAYALSKLANESHALELRAKTGLEVVAIRLFNTIGPDQSGDYGMVVPRFVNQALRGEAITVFGDGCQTRCFTYVGDMVASLRALIEEPAALGRIVNVGGNHEIAIRDLAAIVARLARSRSTIRFIPYRKAYGPGYEDTRCRKPDTRLLESLIGSSPATPLETVLKEILSAHAGAAGHHGRLSKTSIEH